MSTPDAAVEAAADWLPHSGDCEARPERDCRCRHLRLAVMRAALEAAAPHMLTDAWDQGMEHALSWLGQRESVAVMRKDNPYRKGEG